VADITVRKMTFDWPEELELLPIPSDLIRSCELIGISLTLPYLEPYLIRTIRMAAKETRDDTLRADLKNFSSQEAHHHRNHSQVNALIKSKLSPQVVDAVERTEAALSSEYHEFSEEQSLKFNLAYGEGFEAMTLGLALMLFEEGFDHYDPAWAGLVEWHLAEEVEHRTVTFDAYDKIFGSYPYRLRTGTWAQNHYLSYAFRFAYIVWQEVSDDPNRHDPEHNPWGSKRKILSAHWKSGLVQRVLKATPPWYDPKKIEMPASVSAALAKYDALAA